jgi:methionine sulfoxide reductase heme-binding subunit
VGGVNAAEWYSARAGGIVAYILLTAVVLVGLAMSGRERIDGWPRFALEDVHRFLGALTGLFISLHVFKLAVDSEAGFPLDSLIVPFASAYRPFWTGIGIVAAEMLLALAVANHYRDRLSHRTWRRLHYVNFVVWIAATAHGLGAGTDTGSFPFAVVYGAAIACVVVLTARRVVRTGTPRGTADVSAASRHV